MTHRTLAALTAIVVCLAGTCQHAAALPVVAGTTSLPMFPIQDVILPAMSAFNPSDTDLLADDVSVFGDSVFDRMEQTGTTIEFVNGSFTGSGVHPLLGNYRLLTGPDNGLTGMTGTATNVVQDPNHPGYATGDPASVVSGDFVFTVPEYNVELLDLSVVLEVRDSFFFEATFDGLPPSPGTLYVANPYEGDASLLPAYLAGTNDIVGYSTQRRLIAAPEPAAALLLAAGGLGLLTRRRR